MRPALRWRSRIEELALMSCHYPFRLTTWLTIFAVAAFVALTPAVHAQIAQQAALSGSAKADGAKAAPSQATTGATSGNVAATDQANPAPQPPAQPAQQKSLTSRAIDKVKEAAKSAGDIFSRVPCLTPKGGAKSMGSLPHVAAKLAAGQPVVIVAFGSSSTAGYGSTSPEFTYPNRLAAQLHRQYPGADITVVNRGQGGEDAPEMMKRLQHQAINIHPDLLIWPVATNAVLRDLDPTDPPRLVQERLRRLHTAGAALVLLDP